MLTLVLHWQGVAQEAMHAKRCLAPLASRRCCRCRRYCCCSSLALLVQLAVKVSQARQLHALHAAQQALLRLCQATLWALGQQGRVLQLLPAGCEV